MGGTTSGQVVLDCVRKQVHRVSRSKSINKRYSSTVSAFIPASRLVPGLPAPVSLPDVPWSESVSQMIAFFPHLFFDEGVYHSKRKSNSSNCQCFNRLCLFWPAELIPNGTTVSLWRGSLPEDTWLKMEECPRTWGFHLNDRSHGLLKGSLVLLCWGDVWRYRQGSRRLALSMLQCSHSHGSGEDVDGPGWTAMVCLMVVSRLKHGARAVWTRTQFLANRTDRNKGPAQQASWGNSCQPHSLSTQGGGCWLVALPTGNGKEQLFWDQTLERAVWLPIWPLKSCRPAYLHPSNSKSAQRWDGTMFLLNTGCGFRKEAGVGLNSIKSSNSITGLGGSVHFFISKTKQ